MLSTEAIRKLIDYSTKIPKSDDKNEGFKYPFNATEILYCDNNTVIEKMIQMILKNLKKNEEKPQEEPIQKEQTKEEGRT